MDAPAPQGGNVAVAAGATSAGAAPTGAPGLRGSLLGGVLHEPCFGKLRKGNSSFLKESWKVPSAAWVRLYRIP